ncbi:protein DYAD [Selaginella moellendorffii]|nr:protein DYAD [Selaginella moellendorffii]|eukprot:XP_002963002.2 protein DYAD [Selaginella moellendorffii]
MALVRVSPERCDAIDMELKQSSPRCGQFYRRRRRPQALRVEPIQTKICSESEGEDCEKDLSERQIKWGTRKKIKYTTNPDENLQIVVKGCSKSLLKVPKDMQGRWSNERYSAAQESLVLILHEKGATPGAPIARHVLRDEARKFIGDTGLLDHLLKHMSDRVVVRDQRFRRRHNPEGVMEYWLEDASFMELRKDANVSDPWWIPPPGWKKGDPTITNVEGEIRALKVGFDGLRSEMHQVQESSSESSHEAIKSLKEEVELLRSEVQQLQGKPVERLDGLETQVRKMMEEGKLRQELQIVEKLTLDTQFANMWKTVITIQEKLAGMERLENSRYQQRSVFSPCVIQSPSDQKEHAFKLCRPPGTFLMPPASTPSGSRGPSYRVEDILSPRSSSDSEVTMETNKPFIDPVVSRHQMFLTAAVQALQDNSFQHQQHQQQQPDSSSSWLGLAGSPSFELLQARQS